MSPPRHALARLRQPLTDGEQQVLAFFDRYLSHDWEIYIQPHLNGLRPDFVLLNPNVGLAVFEVKDWNLDERRYQVIHQAGNEPKLQVTTCDGDTRILHKDNPIRQVQRYKNELFQLYCPRLAARAGMAAITAGVIFPFADERQLRALLTPFLSPSKDLATYTPLSGRQALARGNLRAVFPEARRRTSRLMTPELAADLRAWLVEPDYAAMQREPLILNRKQQEFATTRTPSGYRRIRGAAGSGKSLVLAARAAELAREGKEVLVISFNITLLNYLRDMVVRWPGFQKAHRDNITWMNFHCWCKRFLCDEQDYEAQYNALWKANSDANPDMKVLKTTLPVLVLQALNAPTHPVNRYDAILVDEGQDFLPAWWSVLRRICKPGGEMLLVADHTQDVYQHADHWTDEAMLGAGFHGKWSELDISYRLPRAAMEQAARYAQAYLPATSRMIPVHAQQDMALEPCSLRWVQLEDSTEAAAVCEQELLRLTTLVDVTNPAMADSTFLCGSRAIGRQVVALLSTRGIRCIDTFDEDNIQGRRQKLAFFKGDARVKATTLHSFKGWESRSLVIHIDARILEQAPSLLYIGLTRLKRHPQGSHLTVVCSVPALAAFGRSWPTFVSPGG